MKSIATRYLVLPIAMLALAGCNNDGTSRETTAVEASAASDYETAGSDNLADSMASNDARYTEGSGSESRDPELDIEDPEDRPIMQAQVVLDRQGFGPGVVDGAMGMSTRNALEGWQEAKGLEVTGELDEATEQSLAEWDRIPATRVVRIPANWSEINYADMPESTADKAKMERLGYKSIDEKLAERFHTTVAVLKELNPDGRPAGIEASSAPPSPSASSTASPTPSSSASASATPSPRASSSGDNFKPTMNEQRNAYFTAGDLIRVPNIGADRIAPGSVDDSSWQTTLASLGVGTEQTEVDRIVVSKAGKTLRAFQGDKLVALFTVSSGSAEFPLPIGEWDIVGEAYNPPYSYDPSVLSGGKEEGEEYTLPPGPNSPVGIVWIDLSKEHYGIHGTPDPETIGRAQSSGCVRLTNWDAARLAQMVNQETRVIFEA